MQWASILFVTVFAAACAETLETETGAYGEFSFDGVVATEPPLEQTGRPVAVDTVAGALTIWPDASRANAIGFLTGFTVELVREPDGTPVQLLPVTAADQLDAEAVGGVAAQIRVTTGVADGGAVYLFYEKLALMADGGARLITSGVCPLARDMAECDRDSGDETLGDALAFRGGTTGDDGFHYLPRCANRAALEQTCVVARVEIENVLDASAYRYYNALSGSWVGEPTSASAVPDELGDVSLRRSASLGGFYLTRLNPFDRRLVTYRASRPEGPYGQPMELALIESQVPFPGGPLHINSLAVGGEATLSLVIATEIIGVYSFRFHGEAQ